MDSSLSNWEDLPKSGVHLNFGPVTLVAFRTGTLVDAGRGIFFGNNATDIKSYQDLHDNAPINQYTITAENVVVAPSVMALYPVLFKGKTFQDAIWREEKNGCRDSIIATAKVETRVAKKVRSMGHDAIVYTKPLLPAKFEITVIDQSSASIEKTASCSNNMSKTAYISPATGDLEIDIIRDGTPRLVINLDLGIPNFTVFSLKIPLVSEEPKNMAVVVQEALGVLLDEVATFMLSLRFDQAVVTDIYARALSCFAGMTMESSTQADYSAAGQDPTQDTYKGTFTLPQSFVQETQKRVVTGAAFVKRVPKQRIIEFVKAIPVNKNTIDDAKRTIQMYKNRQLKTQPKPLYVLVYDMNGNATGVLPVDQQWKSKLLRKIQSWDKQADGNPNEPIVVDQEYNGKGVDTSGTQKFTGVRPQIPANNPAIAGTSTASSATASDENEASDEDEIAAVLSVLKTGPKLPQDVAEALSWDHEKTYGVLQELRHTGIVGVNKMRYYIAGTLGKKGADWQWGKLPGMKNKGIGTPKYPAASKLVDRMMEGNIPPMGDDRYAHYIRAYQVFMEKNEALVSLANEAASKMTPDELDTIAYGEETDQRKVTKKYGKPGQAATKLLNELFDGEFVSAYIVKLERSSAPKKPAKLPQGCITREAFAKKFPFANDMLGNQLIAADDGFDAKAQQLAAAAEKEADAFAADGPIPAVDAFLKYMSTKIKTGKQASSKKNGDVGKEVYDAMEKRCFNLESETDGEAVYERHEGDIRIKVHFNGQEVGDVELNLSGEEDGRWSGGNKDKKHGWEGIQILTNTYGD